MIKLWNADGKDFYVNGDDVSEILPAQSNWHGVRCYVVMRSGTRHDCGVDLHKVAELIEAEAQVSNA